MYFLQARLSFKCARTEFRSVSFTNLAKKQAMRNCAVHISISLYLLIGTTYVVTYKSLNKELDFYAFFLRQHNQEITSICAKIHDHTVVEELNYTLVRYEGRNAISGQVIYKVDIKNILSALTLDLEREGQPVYRMLSMKLDACKFLNGSYNHMPIANLLLRQFNKMKNFAKSCPLKAVSGLTQLK